MAAAASTTSVDSVPAQGRWAAVPLATHAAFWTLAGTLYGAGRAVHPDMLEIYALGKDLSFGYELHPPLVAWIAAAWFEVFPHFNISYFLLAALTSAVGLAGIAGLARQFSATQSSAAAAIWMHALLPFHGLMAMVYNHNTIQLAAWPWTAFWLLRALETRSVAAGLALGTLCALCLLAKYYAVVLFAALCLALVLHPSCWQFLRSKSFGAAVVAAAAVLAPHVAWLLSHATTPFDHALAKTSGTWIITVREAALVLAFVIASHLLLAGVLARALGLARLLQVLSALLASGDHRPLLALAIAPAAVTLLIGFTGLAKISIVFMTPCFFATPVAVLVLLASDETERLAILARNVVIAAAPLVLAALAAFPFVVMSTGWSKAWDAKPELATAALTAWRSDLPDEPAVIAGMAGYPDAIGFYAMPRAKIVRSFRTPKDAATMTQRLSSSGGLVICERSQADCLDAMSRLAVPGALRREVTVTARLHWLEGPPVGFSLLMVPPPPR